MRRIIYYKGVVLVLGLPTDINKLELLFHELFGIVKEQR